MPRAKRVLTGIEEIDEMRHRHVHCVSKQMIALDVRQGRIPNYFVNPERYKAHCDCLDDKICAAPDLSTDSLVKELERIRRDEGT